MTKQTEAMKLALRSIRELVIDESDDAPALQGVRMRKQAAEKALREALANEALDRMAENARELGLDYEVPITMQEGEFDCTHAERLCAELKAAQQKPVAWILKCGEQQELWWEKPPFGDAIALYTSPPPQRNPLTDEQREEIAKKWRGRNWTLGDIIDAVEAAHGIKENA